MWLDQARAGLGDFFIDCFLKSQQAELDRFGLEASDWEQCEDFPVF